MERACSSAVVLKRAQLAPVGFAVLVFDGLSYGSWACIRMGSFVCALRDRSGRPADLEALPAPPSPRPDWPELKPVQ
jgi:hypothetical protein